MENVKVTAGDTGRPGTGYEIIEGTVSETADGYRVGLDHEYGSNQGILEAHHEKSVSGHSGEWQEALNTAIERGRMAGMPEEMLVEVASLVEDEMASRGPGRPEVGPAIKVRLPEPLLTQIDSAASQADSTRAAWIRAALEQHINR